MDLSNRIKNVITTQQALQEFCLNEKNKQIDYMFNWLNAKLELDLSSNENVNNDELFDCENVEKFKSLRDLIVSKLCEK